MPVVGYDLVGRGRAYLRMALEAGLAELASAASLEWYHRQAIRVSVYGNWATVLAETDLMHIEKQLKRTIAETAHYTERGLLFGAFADEGLNRIAAIAQTVEDCEAWQTAYYGQPVGPVDLIVGSGQPVIWDLPLLDLNHAQLYFVQTPTFYLTSTALRQILFDCLYHRHNDDEFDADFLAPASEPIAILGLGERTEYGWTPL
jgi:hypothetical protein